MHCLQPLAIIASYIQCHSSRDQPRLLRRFSCVNSQFQRSFTRTLGAARTARCGALLQRTPGWLQETASPHRPPQPGKAPPDFIFAWAFRLFQADPGNRNWRHNKESGVCLKLQLFAPEPERVLFRHGRPVLAAGRRSHRASGHQPWTQKPTTNLHLAAGNP
ncbi:hypothetical protein N658DRAFT_492728 [Parathielavia hyrcaniae]|uniref:Uncharacterized protein n=1 Tax=Parathielavia hyrcaniae TaxID=113614 RepID=A0AAN6Q817_9PEZI|nr:hypothetical protein N658DRAFT_492728 [Parathielavia hyrcaniae]